MATDVSHARVNRLYWESDRSVSDIADALGVSRRALYDIIEPRPAAVACPDCGGAMGFRNRTSAESLLAECPDCGLELQLDEEPLDTFRPSRPRSGPGAERAEESAAGAAGDGPDASGPLLGSALVAGLALGALAAFAIRRR